jgi:DNA-directed RNA polymerase subunit RPC12/RpoP
MYICPNCKSQIIALKLSVSLSQCPDCGHRWVSVASNKMQENDIKVVMDSMNHYSYTMNKSKNPNFSFPFYVLNNNFVKNKETEKDRNRVFNKNKTNSSIVKLNNGDRTFKSRDFIKNQSRNFNLDNSYVAKNNANKQNIDDKIGETNKSEVHNSERYLTQNKNTNVKLLNQDNKNLDLNKDGVDISLKYENSDFLKDRYNQNVNSINTDTKKNMVEKKEYPLNSNLNNKQSYDRNENSYLKKSTNGNKDLQHSYNANGYQSVNLGKNTIEDVKDIASKYENSSLNNREYKGEKIKNSSLSTQNSKKEALSKSNQDTYFENLDKLDANKQDTNKQKESSYKINQEPYKSNFQPDNLKSNSYKKLQEELAILEGKRSSENNELDDVFVKLSNKNKENILGKELDLDDGSIDGIGSINFGFGSSKSKLAQVLGFKKSKNEIDTKDNDKLKKISNSKTFLIDSIISEDFGFVDKYQTEKKKGKPIENDQVLEEFEKDFDLDLGNQLNHYYEEYSKKKRFDIKNIKLDKDFFKNIKKAKRFNYANIISQIQAMFLGENGYKQLISFTIYLSLIAFSIFGLNYFKPNDKIQVKTKEMNIIKEVPATDDISEQDFIKQENPVDLNNSIPLNIDESVNQQSNIATEETIENDNKKSIVVEADDVLSSLLELKPKEQNKSLKELNEEVESDFSFSAKLNETFLKFKNFKNNLISDVKVINSNISIKQSQNVNNLQLQVVIANASSLRTYFIGNLLVEFVDDKGNTLATRTLKVNRSLSIKETISLKIEFPDLSIRVKKAYVSIL